MWNPMKKILFQFNAFSLVEILVVLGLFSAIATLALGSLFNVQAINGRLQETQAILDNVNMSLQTISRDIRFGSDYYCAQTVPAVIPTVRKNCTREDGGGTVLIFKPDDAAHALDRVVYYIQNGVLYREEHDNAAPVSISQMTARDVNIQALTFYVDGAQTSDGSNDEDDAFDYKQPFITLLISGKSVSMSSNRTPVTFNVETGISPRELDNQ